MYGLENIQNGGSYVKRKQAYFLLVFLLAISFFLYETTRAFGVVMFHADFFEKKGTIVLDAGHGGEDGGAVGTNGVLEKDINLAITLELAKLLRQNNFEVILTRDGDYSVGDNSLDTIAARKKSDTKARLQLVNESGNCILLSVHQNHFSQSQYSGAQVFYSGNTEESAELAEALRQNIVSSTQPENTRQNKQAEKGIYLLYNCQVPAALVECGFLSNAQETEKLCDSAYQKDMATAIYNGLIDYYTAQAEKKTEPSASSFAKAG